MRPKLKSRFGLALRQLFLTCLYLSFSTFPLWAQEGERLGEFDGFKAKLGLEYGHLVQGEYRRTVGSKTAAVPLDMVALNRNIIALSYTGYATENWQYDASFKGTVWWPFSTEIGDPGTRTIRVDPGISVLKARYGFSSEPEASFIEFGFFPYKYNPDAANLGEYLYRSGTYPGDLVTTDGYQFMDRAYYDAYGLHARFPTWEGRWIHDVNLFTEATLQPLGDFTPAYESTLKLAYGEFGIGAAYNRGLSYRPSKTRPYDEENLYIEVPADAAKGYAYYKGPFLGAPSAVREDPAKPYTVLHRWSQRGLKLMARGALGLSENPEGFRLFAEIAVLGTEDQPYYYEKIAERIPVMVGMNVPTWGFLDKLSLQAEYYGSKFNNVSQADRASVPIWTVANYATGDLDTYTPNKWRWSLHGRRRLNRLVDLHAQVANDHLRMRNVLSTRSDYDLTQKSKHWYYLLKLEMGI